MQGRKTMASFLITLGMMGTGAAVAGAQQGPPPPPGYYNQPWTQPPAEYQDPVARRGFHDGIEGARRDFQNHRPPNVENRDEFRHPEFHGPARRIYRQAFRRGYDTGVRKIYGGARPY